VTWIWREIGVRWYISRITGGLKEERKKGRFIRALRRRKFPIFPDFTVRTICVMKYIGIMNNVVQERCNNPEQVHRNNVPQEACKTVPQSKIYSVVYYQMALD